MGYTSLVVVLLGFGAGIAFRLKALLPVLALLLVASIVSAFIGGASFIEAALAIIAVQCIAQLAYFSGLLFRSLIDMTLRTRPIL
jgi:hypothetical protein